jgi:predicted HicB family RNase H-like nuclease
MMEYKGYTSGPIAVDPEDNVLSGTVAGLRDIVHFEGSTGIELAQAFRDSIDTYLEVCREDGRPADRPFSGRFLVRMQPDLHRKAALQAAAEGVSISQWISRRIDAA